MDYLKVFTETYKKLNKEQKLAVDTIDGPVMVVAGPGTGKTQILTLRIANILNKTDVGASAILAITFTESGVRAMRKRLLSIIGPDAHKVHIYTFHAFCNNLILNYPEYFPDIVGAVQANEVDSLKIIEQIIDDLRPELLRPRGDNYLYVRDIIGAIDELKREGYRASNFLELVKKAEKDFNKTPDLHHEKGAHKGKMKGEHKETEKNIKKNLELANIYQQYEKKMLERRIYDYSDMILYVHEALRDDEDFRQIVQESYQYILVDEHQDTNQAQNAVIDILASFFADNPNLFVVGDDKQGVYRFQGASILNFTEFVRKYPKTRVINLVENYRSEASILAYAENILAGSKPLKSQTKNMPKINVFECNNPFTEVRNLVVQVQKIIKQGVEPREIAILYRTNKESFEIANALSKEGIKYIISSDRNIYETIIARKVLKIIEAIIAYEDDEAIMSAMHIRELGLHPHDVFLTIRKSHDAKKKTIFSFLYDTDSIGELKLLKPDSFLNFANNFKKWIELRDEKNARAMIEMILRESGILDEIIRHTKAEDIEDLNSLMNDIDQFLANNKKSTIAEFYDYVNLKKRYKIYSKVNKVIEGNDHLKLMTAHSAKGLEFEHVFIMHANAGIWSNRRSVERLKLIPEVYGLTSTNRDDGLDERRLFYVAITRAKKGLHISYANSNIDGKELLPAEYIESIPNNLKEHSNIILNINDIVEDIQKINIEPEKVEIEFINTLLDNQGLSPTALNNYISCPWKYFYRNLIRLPEPTEPHMAYGTAMHAGVEALFKNDKLGKNKDLLIQGFEEALLKQPLSKADFKEFLKRGREALLGWYDNSAKSFIYPREVEKSFRRVSFDEVVFLTGKLDAIETIDENIVRVTDFKTGKPKSRNEIMGNTKSGDGAYYRQLIFYKILIDEEFDGRVLMQNAVLDFLEPNDSGKYQKEVFEISKDEVDELKQKIIEVAHEIRNLDFWGKVCDDKDCKYCSLREMMN